MATLVFAKEFLEDFIKLEPSVRQKVRELPGKFEHSARTGVHLEKLTGARDDRVRTVRVDQFWRGVVVRLGEGRHALLRVLAHDEANRWAERQQFAVNPVTGIIEILDIPTVTERVEAVAEAAEAPGLFEGRRDRDFTAVGIDEELVPVLRRIGDESELLAIANHLPDAQCDAVLLLADGRSADEVWSELANDYELSSGEVDTDDIDTALQKPGTRSHFVVTTSDTELVELLSGDFEAWRTFLHPTQRSVAYRPVFRGPAKVTGGAGTGKTVVAIHRARFLAQQLNDSGDDSSRVLVTTYTNSLADNLDRTLRNFCAPEEYRRLQITTVDSLARRTLSAAKLRVQPVQNRTLRQLADEAAAMAGLDHIGRDWRFLLTEWEQVILARGLTSLVDYATSPRPGRGTRLVRSSRKRVWAALEQLLSDLERKGLATYPQLADLAADQLAGRRRKPFAHVIVDEAQDLHPAQWRLLRQAVAAGPNDLFIAGDAHQRIYDHHVSLLSLGIDTRGKSRRLKINYRTSQQILGWTLGILTGQPIDDLDGDIESEVGYRSAFDGPVPTIQLFGTPAEEAEFVAAQVEEWIEEGVARSAVGITARRRQDLRAVQTALDEIDVRWTEVGASARKPGVQVGTMHSFKGLEFARLAVVAANSENLPLPIAVTPAADDQAQHDLEVLRERCLLFVACTRARDELVVTSSGRPSDLLPRQ